MPQATDIITFGELEAHVLAVAAAPGDIVVTKDGLAAVVCGVNPGKATSAIGESVSVSTNAMVTLAKASGTTVADGAVAQWDDTNNLVVATGGTYKLGGVIQTLTTTSIRVRLNSAKL
jgi:predicted RecA/RadA family phage recombinase